MTRANFNLPDFERDIAQHRMTVLRDDGAHRHLRFKRPLSTYMFFEIVTWPGHLCYTGDMGAYVFSRLDDMFQFFRTDRDDIHRIDHRYWAEKVVASDKGDGIKHFSEDAFKENVKRYVFDWMRENRGSTTAPQQDSAESFGRRSRATCCTTTPAAKRAQPSTSPSG